MMTKMTDTTPSAQTSAPKTASYTLVGTSLSRGLRVLWALEELGLEYGYVPARPRSDEVRAVNPTGKVPAMVVDGQVLTDSAAIITFLADRHGTLTHPAGTLTRARQDGLMLRVLDEVDAVLWTAARHTYTLPEERRVPAIRDSLGWELARNLAALADVLGDGPFLMGETFTLPDIVLATCLAWAERQGFPAPDARLQAYRARLEARPAYQRAAAR
jgi:glutathione S-transferase